MELNYNFDHAGAAAVSEFADLVSKRIAPTADWSAMSRFDHFVQFYESDEHIADSVAEYIIHGLRNDETCVVVATPEHRTAVESMIRGFGVDLDGAIADRRYVARDAQASLDLFMVDGKPNKKLFNRTVGAIVTHAAKKGGVRVYGEMVAVLLAGGQSEAALALEGLWEDLRQKHEFSLFCAYPILDLAGKDGARTMLEVCQTHSKVIPSESYTSLSTSDERMRAVALLQQRTHQLEAELAELRAGSRH